MLRNRLSCRCLGPVVVVAASLHLVACGSHVGSGGVCESACRAVDGTETSELWNNYVRISSSLGPDAKDCFVHALKEPQLGRVALGAVGLWASQSELGKDYVFDETFAALTVVAARLSGPVARTYYLYGAHHENSFDDALARHDSSAETDDIRELRNADLWMERIPPPLGPRSRGAEGDGAFDGAIGDGRRWLPEAVCEMIPGWFLFYLEARGRPPWFVTRPGFKFVHAYLRWIAAFAGGDWVGAAGVMNEQKVRITKDNGLCREDSDCLDRKMCVQICDGGEGLCIGRDNWVNIMNKYPRTMMRILKIE